jgi:hypothetical protein
MDELQPRMNAYRPGQKTGMPLDFSAFLVRIASSETFRKPHRLIFVDRFESTSRVRHLQDPILESTGFWLALNTPDTGK